MVTFKKSERGFVISYDENINTAEEYFLLNDLNTSKNLDFLYW